MFGILRYILALAVAFAHLWPDITPDWLAWYAVIGFFVLSGYLITHILIEVYPYTPVGIIRFLVNRGLRIYPTYYVILVLSLMLFLLAPSYALENAFGRTPEQFWPHSFWQWIGNITMLGMNGWVQSCSDCNGTIPFLKQMWSLNVELVLGPYGYWVISFLLVNGFMFYHGISV